MQSFASGRSPRPSAQCGAAGWRFARCSVVALATAAVGTTGAVPKGHLEPFGSWGRGTPVEERTDIPEPREFFDEYGNSDGGHGRPVIFRGAAKSMEAMERWATDESLLERYGSEHISGVEYNLKETRAGGNVDGMNVMRDFLNAYNTTDIYMVSQVPKAMMKDVSFLPCIRCGGYQKFLDTNNIWVGRGGSKSVIHYDDQDNINCLFSGSKRFVFMHPRYKKEFEAHPNTKKNLFGWVDTDLDRSLPGYGAFFGKLDIDKVDLIKYPGWSEVDWSYVTMAPGDCVYIPYQWYHQVTAAPVRSINSHIWYWRPQVFDEKSCLKESGGESSSFTFADCSWGYEPPNGHLGVKKKGGKKLTKCRKASAQAKPAAAGEL